MATSRISRGLHDTITGSIDLPVRCNESNKDSIVYSDEFPATGINRFRIKAECIYNEEFSENSAIRCGTCIVKYYILHWKLIDDVLKDDVEIIFQLHYTYYPRTVSGYIDKTYSIAGIKLYKWHLIDSHKFNEFYSINKISINFFVSLPASIKKEKDIIADLYEDDELCDFKLTSEDGASVNVHKFVLASYSEVFKNMFKGNWKEANESHMCITGSDAELLKEFKEILYLGKFPNKNLDKHTKLICMYDMASLKENIAIKLYDSVNPENVLHILNIASIYDLKPLIRALSYFIFDNGSEIFAPEPLLAKNDP